MPDHHTMYWLPDETASVVGPKAITSLARLEQIALEAIPSLRILLYGLSADTPNYVVFPYNVRMSESLLRTKLFVPPLRPDFVPRNHLIDRLDQGLQQGHKMTLISAPAGFGKTTLVSDWVDSFKEDETKNKQFVNRIAWLSLDEGDNDLKHFLS